MLTDLDTDLVVAVLSIAAFLLLGLALWRAPERRRFLHVQTSRDDRDGGPATD